MSPFHIEVLTSFVKELHNYLRQMVNCFTGLSKYFVPLQNQVPLIGSCNTMPIMWLLEYIVEVKPKYDYPQTITYTTKLTHYLNFPNFVILTFLNTFLLFKMVLVFCLGGILSPAYQ